MKKMTALIVLAILLVASVFGTVFRDRLKAAAAAPGAEIEQGSDGVGSSGPAPVTGVNGRRADTPDGRSGKVINMDQTKRTGSTIDAAFAGSFYPGDPKTLAESIRGYIDAADSTPVNHGWAWISPHAGYRYSGPIAGHVFRQIESVNPSRVVVIGFAHRPRNPNGYSRTDVIATTTAAAFKTPLGEIPVDVEEVRNILFMQKMVLDNQQQMPDSSSSLTAQVDFLIDDATPFADEHSIEVQIPFIQVAAPKAKLVPLMFHGREKPWQIRRLAALIARYARDPGTVVIASSDMSHYFPYDEALERDHRALDAVKSLDTDTLRNLSPSRQVEFCGMGPVLTLMTAHAIAGGTGPVVLDYRNSGDTAGDRNKVVGYGAVQFPRPAFSENENRSDKAQQTTTASAPPADDSTLTPDRKRRLLAIARQTVETVVKTGKVPDFTEMDPVLLEPGAAFVTLKKNGSLRGCIGHTEPHLPLWKCVRNMAVAASTQDSRFRPVTPEELPDIEYEISVLFPSVPVTDVSEIQVGRDGLTIELNGHRGLLLPQVPVEWGWDRDEFLAQTSRKAGLRPDAWREPDARLRRFQGIIFGEDD